MYRLYSFINCYLSSIQQGIQTAHLVSEIMSNPYNIIPYNKDFVNDWATKDRTIIVCNGGNCKSIQDTIGLFKEKDNLFPWTAFCEDEESLEGTLTGVCIILPEEIYDVKFDLINSVYIQANGRIIDNRNTHCYHLIDMVKSAKLAI